MRKDVINTPGVRWANKYVLKKEVEEDGVILRSGYLIVQPLHER